MKYNKYFETSIYRECNNQKTEANIKNAEHKIYLATVRAFFLGMLDCLLVGLLKSNFNGAVSILLAIVCGAVCGGLLAWIWIATIRTIRGTYREYSHEIYMLTQKLDAMQNQEEPEEDYELVGDRDD